jgi:acetyl-CoA carboxylase biotin carboxylase subunit
VTPNVFRKVLIANRGEIAIRIARACRELGIASVAVYSEADRSSPHVLAADEAVCIGPPPSRESYLNVEAILDAARATGADAVHPGYGFLSENAPFARAVEGAGLTFIGPSPEAIAAMGDKVRARDIVSQVGVPVVPAVQNPPEEEGALRAAAVKLGFPLLIKAAAGGGGKGMRIVRSEEEFPPAYAAAEREATAAFGDGRLFLERYFDRTRHIEVQILADAEGTTVHLGERECSIQRRYQKIVEESPSPAVTPEVRARLTEAAIAAAHTVRYRNAGTVEFLFTGEGDFYFLEMNTRLQVEHPVTEWVTGFDLVHAQIRIAAGERLWVTQEDLRPRGHAIECRVYAEDPAQHFLPSPGRIVLLDEPHGPGIRVDSGIGAGHEVPLHYDPMLAKLSVWGADREAARRRMIEALRGYVVLGITTSIPFLIDVLSHPEFVAGRTHTHFLADHLPLWRPAGDGLEAAALAAALHTALIRTARGTTTQRATMPTPWETLGAFRLGSGRDTL